MPPLSERVFEGIAWPTGDYYTELDERSLDGLVEAQAVPTNEFRTSEACHVNDDGTVMTRDDLVALTADYERNPRVAEHQEYNCGTYHKAHRASVSECSAVTTTPPIPEGWLSVSQAKKLDMPA